VTHTDRLCAIEGEKNLLKQVLPKNIADMQFALMN
jgi:hypothetical protein